MFFYLPRAFGTLIPRKLSAGKNRGKTKYAPVVKLADTLDFGCVTTVHLYPASSGQVNFKSKN